MFWGDIRGCGLFIGIEFVKDEVTREPASALASLVCCRMKNQHFILTSLDGPGDNVMVLKPPMVFSEEDAKKFILALSAVLAGVTEQDMANATHTPT